MSPSPPRPLSRRDLVTVEHTGLGVQKQVPRSALDRLGSPWRVVKPKSPKASEPKATDKSEED